MPLLHVRRFRAETTLPLADVLSIVLVSRPHAARRITKEPQQKLEENRVYARSGVVEIDLKLRGRRESELRPQPDPKHALLDTKGVFR